MTAGGRKEEGRLTRRRAGEFKLGRKARSKSGSEVLSSSRMEDEEKTPYHFLTPRLEGREGGREGGRKEGDVSPPAVFVSGDEIFSSGGVGVGAVLVVVVVGKPVNR